MDEKVLKAEKEWRKNVLEPHMKKNQAIYEGRSFTTISDMDVPVFAGPSALNDVDPIEDIGFPGVYPYTRGVQPDMYRGKLWTMRQFAGFGTPKDTNNRFKYLLSQGMAGLSTAFDMPTLMGYDADHNLARGEVGREGVNVSTLADMEILFDGIPLDEVTVSMTINAPAIILLGMYIAMADKRGISRSKLGGTIQADMLKEFIAQKEWICPPKPSVKLVTDMVEFCTNELPRWNSVSISGYHIREAGATAAQELAFTLADGMAYVESAIERGLDVDSFAPRLSFFFDVHNDFFEEIAKFRAARRIWARQMRERYKAKNPKSWMLRTHAQTAGVSLTAQQPMNNIARVTMQAMAAILGGTNSLHTNSMDETLALPSEQAAKVALRTQQIIAEESGITNTVDPLAGSYFVEHMTNKIEAEALSYISKIYDFGGMIEAIEEGFPQKEIAASAYRYQQQLDKKEKIIVGVNKHIDDEEQDIPLLKIEQDKEDQQIRFIKKIKSKRSPEKVEKSLARIRKDAIDGKNLLPSIIDAVKDYVSVGEISDVFREVYGVYRDPANY
ncbi:MAG: methylmalonyl-CoA mutase family protein [Oligoflexia bacterium]|nr:methylmalonyl-CoA mutase family protein [Oligoflexia bacterium]